MHFCRPEHQIGLSEQLPLGCCEQQCSWSIPHPAAYPNSALAWAMLLTIASRFASGTHLPPEEFLHGVLPAESHVQKWPWPSAPALHVPFVPLQ
jgi:hypothetical protein